MILSCVFFPSRGLKQIVSFVSTPRKSRPPLGEGEEEVDSKVGKNLGWPKSGPSEFVEGKKQRSARILDPGNSQRESASFFPARPREIIF